MNSFTRPSTYKDAHFQIDTLAFARTNTPFDRGRFTEADYVWLGCAHRRGGQERNEEKDRRSNLHELESPHVSNYALRSLKHKDTRHTAKQFP